MFENKRRHFGLLFGAEIIVLAVLLIGCFRKEETIYSFGVGDGAGVIRDTEGGREFTGSPLELKPGVYQIRMKAGLQEGQSIFVQMKCEKAHFKALRNNGAAVRPGSEELTLQVYVTDRISDAYLYCLFSGAGEENLTALEVVRTTMGNRMALFLAAVLFAALDFLVEFRKKILAGQITGKRQLVFWGLAAGVLVAYFPYLTDHFSLGEESIYQLRRIDYLRGALAQGGLPAAWRLGNGIYEQGYSASLFCSDLFLYLPAALMLLGFSVMSAYKWFLLAVQIFTAWIAWHCFYRCLREEYAALFGSLLYLWNPYYLFMIYGKAAVGEYLAMAFLPLVCCGMYLLYTQEVSADEYRSAKWYVILGISGVLQSHLISAGITVALMALVCAVFWKKTVRKQAAVQLAAATAVVLAVNAGFLLPRLWMAGAGIYGSEYLMQGGNLREGISFAGIFQLLPHRGGAQIGMWNGEPAQPGVGILLLMLLYLLWRYRGHKTEKICGILAALSVLSIALGLEFGALERLSGIPVLGQAAGLFLFTSRWLAPAAVLASLFGAFFFLEVQKSESTRLKFLTGTVALTAVFAAVYLVNDYVFKSTSCFLYNIENLGIAGALSGGYLPSGTDVSGLSSCAAVGSIISMVSVAALVSGELYLGRKRVRNGRKGQNQ